MFIHELQRTLNDAMSFDKYLRNTYADYLGMNINSGAITLEFNVDQTIDIISSIESVAEPTISAAQLISNKIGYYRSKARPLLDSIYSMNTLSGMTTDQSANLMQQMRDVVNSIQEGLFPTAKRILENLPITDELTQARKDSYISIITGAMV